jgi:hypothetical protein
VDLLFFVDIFVNFLSAFERKGTNIYETRPGYIAKDYLTGWFIIDVIACIPIPVIEALLGLFSDDVDKESSSLSKLARLPRIYRVVRIIRIFKILKVFKYSGLMGKCVGKLNMSSGSKRVFSFLAFACFLVHIMACVYWL